MLKKYSYSLFIPLISLLFLSLSFPGEALKGKYSADKRYIDHGDGTITDTRTNLMWTKKDSYADTRKCMDWNASKSYVSKLNSGGYSDWRLPSVQELKGIYEESKMNKDFEESTIHSDQIFASDGASVYWSSETVGSCCARLVNFNFGHVFLDNRANCYGLGVRAVRRP